jgi:hypothetical protein
VRELVPVAARNFGLVGTHAQGEAEETGVSFVAITGAVPIHLFHGRGGEKSKPMFHLVMAHENRPALMTAQADPKTSQGILIPGSKKTWGMGCLALEAGQVVHFDIMTTWHGITGLPTGGKPWNIDDMGAVIIRVPSPDPAAIQRAVAIARQAIVADGRFQDILA